MKEKGILFSAPMVRAILDNRKTQTRREVKPQPVECGFGRNAIVKPYCTGTDWPLAYYERRGACWNSSKPLKCPYPVGTRVYVKETFAVGYGKTWYRASDTMDDSGMKVPWKPSIFMPKWAARIWLEIVAVRVERLQDISEEDAKAEGVEIRPSAGIASNVCKGNPGPAQFEYYALWESINGPGSWDLNPWVWAYTFRRIEK